MDVTPERIGKPSKRKLKKREYTTPERTPEILNDYEKGIIVIGGGIAGIQASLDLAKAGVKVYLVEKRETIGGTMSKLAEIFPSMDCAT